MCGWIDICGSIILKNQDDRGAQPRVTALILGSVWPGRRVLGIEVRGAESRRKAPLIEGHSTKLFPLNLPLGRDRGALP